MRLNTDQRQIRIKPLSEGIGLGTLQSARNPSHKLEQIKTDHQPIVRQQQASMSVQAQMAYAPHSVATQIRNRPSVRWYVWLSRIAAGVGVDIFVGTFSLFVLAWTGLIAWNAGSTGDFNPLAALIMITDFLEKFSAIKCLLVIVCAAVVWRCWKIAFSGKRTA